MLHFASVNCCHPRRRCLSVVVDEALPVLYSESVNNFPVVVYLFLFDSQLLRDGLRRHFFREQLIDLAVQLVFGVSLSDVFRDQLRKI